MRIEGSDLYHEDNGEGVPILLIHPAGATASSWGTVADNLARVGRVITYDRRGYQRSGGQPVRSIPTHTWTPPRFLMLSTPPAIAVGISVGETIAIDLALRRPELARAVVAHESPWLVTRQPPTISQLVAPARMGWLAAQGRHPEAAAFLRFAYTYRGGGTAWDAFPEEWRRAVAENAQAALTDIRIAVSGYPSSTALAAVTRPVVCTYGARSAQLLARVARSLARAMPTAKVSEIQGAGHAAALDAPANFVQVIVDVIHST